MTPPGLSILLILMFSDAADDVYVCYSCYVYTVGAPLGMDEIMAFCTVLSVCMYFHIRIFLFFFFSEGYCSFLVWIVHLFRVFVLFHTCHGFGTDIEWT